VYIQVKEK
jgi:hypothetical protein